MNIKDIIADIKKLCDLNVPKVRIIAMHNNIIWNVVEFETANAFTKHDVLRAHLQDDINRVVDAADSYIVQSALTHEQLDQYATTLGA